MFSRLDSSLKLFGTLIIVIVACLATLPILSSSQANATLDALKEGGAKERAYNLTLSLLKDAETGQRGFLIAGDESFLDPYRAGVAGIPAAVEELQQRAGSDKERTLVARIAELSRAKVAEMDQTIRLKKAGDTRAAMDMVASQRGKIMMDELRALLGAQLRVLAGERTRLRDELTATLGYNSALGIGASLASLVLIVATVYIVTRSLNERAQAASESRSLAERNAQLARQSAVRAERLSIAADMLQALDSVRTPPELERVLPVFLRKLLPATAGAVYLYRNSRDVLELKASWGLDGEAPPMVAPGDCWGLRLGKVHVATLDHDLCCDHGAIRGGAHATQTCVPMISQGDVIGVLVVAAGRRDDARRDDARRDDDAVDSAHVVALAEQLSLAISNVSLRDTLRHQSTVDPLTGLYNRRFFDESLKRELARAQRSRSACSVVMVDLDHFKRVNDTHGHEGGDLVLQAASRAMLQRVRASDVVCRYGGEELVLMLPDCGAEEAVKCAEAIRASIAGIVIQHQGLTISGISASFGVAQWRGHGEGEQELLQAADRALYAAKKGGRNRVVVADADLPPRGREAVAA
ncbi:diguanylate cyclase [Massilia forsythiae]|uniref:diguanylate cyclase n=1 Tax=Massilia forsythiae TaxID=2728020 RepID=A0A7Z2ZVU2_9BURK|nr:diguanylate cyclase [Massilia forsythiae]QJE02487.1 diguanylate cyclase [Massilia forsythiae]